MGCFRKSGEKSQQAARCGTRHKIKAATYFYERPFTYYMKLTI